MFILGVDFDGTIVDHQFPAVGKPAPRVFFWLKAIQAAGARLVLWTMRSDGRKDGSTPLADAVAFCRAGGVEFWSVNGNPEQGRWTSSPKAYCHAYADDAAIGTPMIHPEGFAGPVVDWDVVGPMVLKHIAARQEALGKQT